MWGTTAVDFIANKKKGGKLEAKVETLKAQDYELKQLQKELDEQAEILTKVIKMITPREAKSFVL